MYERPYLYPIEYAASSDFDVDLFVHAAELFSDQDDLDILSSASTPSLASSIVSFTTPSSSVSSLNSDDEPQGHFIPELGLVTQGIDALNETIPVIDEDKPFQPTLPLKTRKETLHLPVYHEVPSSPNVIQPSPLPTVSEIDGSNGSDSDVVDDEYLPASSSRNKKRRRENQPRSARSQKKVRQTSQRLSRNVQSGVTLRDSDVAYLNFRCDVCGWVQRNRRLPDFKRHRRTHMRSGDWVCTGVPLEDSPLYKIPNNAGSFFYLGKMHIAGCMKSFSRSDALLRHLRISGGILMASFIPFFVAYLWTFLSFDVSVLVCILIVLDRVDCLGKRVDWYSLRKVI